MEPDFWEACKKYNVIMTPTKYPGVDWDKIEQRAREFQYQFSYFGATTSSKKVSRKFVLDISGSQNMKKSFSRCCVANCTVALRAGRLATCCFVFNIRHFNAYFNQNIPVTDLDSIDIYTAKNIREVLKFLASPIPLCSYCKSMGDEIVGEWRKTEKEISEWT
jgi:hypothetical protein